MNNGYRKTDPKTKMVFVDSEVEVVITIVKMTCSFRFYVYK